MMTVPAFEINQIDSFQNCFDSYYMWFQNMIFSAVLEKSPSSGFAQV